MVLRAALKVKAKWLRMMQGKKVRGCVQTKTVEVRKYLPWQRTPRGHEPLERGDRFYLLAGGEVWGSAVLEDAVEYTGTDAFAADVDAHCVTGETCRGLKSQEVQGIVKALACGHKLYGWKLTAMRWFGANERPRSGENGVPEFAGQGKGWVWSVNQLPAELESTFDDNNGGSSARMSAKLSVPPTEKTDSLHSQRKLSKVRGLESSGDDRRKSAASLGCLSWSESAASEGSG